MVFLTHGEVSLEESELLKEGIIGRVGIGSSVNIWSDPWLPRGNTRKPATPRGQSLLTRVSELGDEQLILETFWPEEDAQIILAIPIVMQMEDWPAWHFDPKGLFSVKYAYKLAVQIR